VVEDLRRRASRFGLDLVLVNVWEGAGAAEEARGYVERWGIEGTVLLDESAEFARAVGVRGVPTNVFVDERGTVRGVGASSAGELLAGAIALEPRLGEEGSAAGGHGRMPSGFAETDEGS
jgi:hypothetical protein